MLSLTEHVQTQLNDECSCHTHHWSTVQSLESVRAAGGLVRRANSALDFAVFDQVQRYGQKTVYRTDTVAWNRESSEPASLPNPISFNAERI